MKSLRRNCIFRAYSTCFRATLTALPKTRINPEGFTASMYALFFSTFTLESKLKPTRGVSRKEMQDFVVQGPGRPSGGWAKVDRQKGKVFTGKLFPPRLELATLSSNLSKFNYFFCKFLIFQICYSLYISLFLQFRNFLNNNLRCCLLILDVS